jgi:UDP-glucuronate decarboxylase
MKRILVTGGNGFLGKHLCSKLKEQGHEVVSYDIHSGNIIDSPAFYFNQIFGHEIYNLAGIPSPAKYLKDPISTAKVNTVGMFNVLESARKCGAKVLQASTIEVYGNTNWTDEKSCYREGKKMAESICFDYNRKYSMLIKIARMGNSYGPLMSKDDGRVIPEFIQLALNNDDIYVYGNQTRSFCYVDDMVDGLIGLMNNSSAHILDFYHQQEITIQDLAKLIVDLTGSKSRIVYRDSLNGDINQVKLNGDNSAYKYIGWNPQVSLEEGLKKTIEYFMEEI